MKNIRLATTLFLSLFAIVGSAQRYDQFPNALKSSGKGFKGKVKTVDCYAHGDKYHDVYSFSADGWLLSENNYNEGELYGYVKIKYDKNGHPVLIEDIYSTEKLTFDGNLPVTSVTSLKEDKITHKAEIDYIYDGLKSTVTLHKGKNPINDEKVFYSYDGLGNLIEMKTLKRKGADDWSVKKKSKFHYGRNNVLQTELVYSNFFGADTADGSLVLKKIYDERGNQIEEYRYQGRVKGTDEYIVRENKEMKYDANNFITERKYFVGGKLKEHVTYKNMCDANGNLVECEEYNVLTGRMVVRRSVYTYY